MTVSLIPMTEAQFLDYQAQQIQHYAEEKVNAGTWTQEEAPSKAEEAFQRLLPEGASSEHNFLHTLINDENKEEIGWLWYKFNLSHPQKEAFIYDFVIFEQVRGEGFGRKALTALDVHARKKGIRKLSLHVFAHNHRAFHLYEKLGYQPTDINMSKSLK